LFVVTQQNAVFVSIKQRAANIFRCLLVSKAVHGSSPTSNPTVSIGVSIYADFCTL
jgi:hypothetical protein